MSDKRCIAGEPGMAAAARCALFRLSSFVVAAAATPPPALPPCSPPSIPRDFLPLIATLCMNGRLPTIKEREPPVVLGPVDILNDLGKEVSNTLEMSVHNARDQFRPTSDT